MANRYDYDDEKYDYDEDDDILYAREENDNDYYGSGEEIYGEAATD